MSDAKVSPWRGWWWWWWWWRGGGGGWERERARALSHKFKSRWMPYGVGKKSEIRTQNTEVDVVLMLKETSRHPNANLCSKCMESVECKAYHLKRWRWFGHTLRKPVTCTTCQALTLNPQDRTSNAWRRDLEAETEDGLRLGTPWEAAQDLDGWRALEGGSCSSRGQRQWWWWYATWTRSEINLSHQVHTSRLHTSMLSGMKKNTYTLYYTHVL